MLPGLRDPMQRECVALGVRDDGHAHTGVENLSEMR